MHLLPAGHHSPGGPSSSVLLSLTDLLCDPELLLCVSEPHPLNKSWLIVCCGLDLSQLLTSTPVFLMSLRIWR